MIPRSSTLPKRVKARSIYVVLAIIIVAYSLFAARDIIRGPEIIVTNPKDGSSMATSTVTVTGQALRVRELSLNSRPIVMDQSGHFSETFLIYPGLNPILLEAEDRFGKYTSRLISVVGIN